MWWKKWTKGRHKLSNGIAAKGITGNNFRPQHLKRDLKFNKEMLQHILGSSLDVNFRDVTLAHHGPNAIILYLDNMADAHEINENLLKSIMLQAPPIPEKDAFDVMWHTALTIGEVYVARDFDQLVEGVIFGDTAILIDGFDTAIICGTKGFKGRSIGEPNAEEVVRGPKEAFTEMLLNNVTQLRRRIRTPYLRFEALSVGRLTSTDIALVYIEGVADPEVVDEVRRRIKGIDTDSILESGYIEEYIEDHPYSPFPQIEHTERPDKVARRFGGGQGGHYHRWYSLCAAGANAIYAIFPSLRGLL
ncbi:spore germination protein [Peptococcaceae bacterium 1198_IL3148]